MFPETELDNADAGAAGGSISINVTLFLGVGTGVLFGPLSMSALLR